MLHRSLLDKFKHTGLNEYLLKQGRRNRGGRGGFSPPTLETKGAEPPILSQAYATKVQQRSSVIIVDVCKSARVKITTKSVPKLLSECIRNTLRELKFPKFSGGACPQTPLGGLCSLTVVIVHSQRSEPPTFATCSPPLCVYEDEHF